MNYLIHAYLSNESPAAIYGGLLGDFVKGRDLSRFDDDVASAIRLHRMIDRYSDQHPIYQQSRFRLGSEYRRVSGIAIDVIYDHFIAKHWSEFDEQSLPNFAQRVYRALNDYRDEWPADFADVAPYIIDHDWLGSYDDITAIKRVLNGISRRIRFPNNLHSVIYPIEQQYSALENDFFEMMPALSAFVQSNKREFIENTASTRTITIID